MLHCSCKTSKAVEFESDVNIAIAAGPRQNWLPISRNRTPSRVKGMAADLAFVQVIADIARDGQKTVLLGSFHKLAGHLEEV